ncbi:hypothetical protein TDMWS_15080 [Thermodesulfomicrobium sp. WS]|uniref:sensor histidine kinase n=1 Tax=Thermodesulfomicrobium sp. WS TaxID=3004129 RepID=UPI00249363FC|nr:hypothetical protein [Thermodesulfomicrobium sp. WS]BDV01423.1 hypothetical protein TDMWS_15080 [Thermodesulfomicrobium sp. WS]
MTFDSTRAMGAMTAMTTHELQNILAIIRESAGLLGDILDINAKVALQHRPKIHEALEHIATQVDRGKRLLTAMNRLGHATDVEQQESCDLSPQVAALMDLCQRPARLKEIQLRFTPAGQPLPVRTSAMDVFSRGFTVLRAAIDLCPAGSVLDASIVPGPPQHALVMTLPVSPKDSPVLAALAEAGHIEIHGRTIHLLFPAATP